jgi:wyosine [tRNA(Phe)-imidazoG37] synthetase (radical SAM superfamily)
MRVERRAFYEPEEVVRDVERKVEEADSAGEAIDYLTFVPDGEPTLDVNLGREIELLRPLGIKIAVISNGSLIWQERVREQLGQADWVSLKVDAASREIWHQIDRPHRRLQLRAMQDGMLALARGYEGVLATETMLVNGVNDGEDAVKEVATFLARLKPDRAYVAIPTRPPAVAWAHAPDEERVNRAYQVISDKVDHAEYLIGYEGNAFAQTGDVEEDLLSITSVHPMREEAVRKFLARADADWSVVRRLVARDELVEADCGDRRFYLSRLNRHRDDRG